MEVGSAEEGQDDHTLEVGHGLVEDGHVDAHGEDNALGGPVHAVDPEHWILPNPCNLLTAWLPQVAGHGVDDCHCQDEVVLREVAGALDVDERHTLGVVRSHVEAAAHSLDAEGIHVEAAHILGVAGSQDSHAVVVLHDVQVVVVTMPGALHKLRVDGRIQVVDLDADGHIQVVDLLVDGHIQVVALLLAQELLLAAAMAVLQEEVQQAEHLQGPSCHLLDHLGHVLFFCHLCDDDGALPSFLETVNESRALNWKWTLKIFGAFSWQPLLHRPFLNTSSELSTE